MSERACPKTSETHLGEDDIIERRCFLLELGRDRLISGNEILRHHRQSNGVLEKQGQTFNTPP